MCSSKGARSPDLSMIAEIVFIEEQNDDDMHTHPTETILPCRTAHDLRGGAALALSREAGSDTQESLPKIRKI